MTPSDAIQCGIFGVCLLTMLSGGALALIKIGAIYREMRPDGGESVKDRIAALEQSQAAQTRALRRIESRQKLFPCVLPHKKGKPCPHAAGGRRATPTNRTTAPPLITPPTHPKRINP